MKVNFYEQTEDELLKFAVIVSRSNGKWVFCKHREWTTYECPYYADIQSFEPELHSEIERIVLWEEPPAECQWTYPEIQPLLLEHVSKILSAR